MRSVAVGRSQPDHQRAHCIPEPTASTGLDAASSFWPPTVSLWRGRGRGTRDGESVIAGYPWFGDWGRDTMIALPGLTLATRPLDTARRILRDLRAFRRPRHAAQCVSRRGESPNTTRSTPRCGTSRRGAPISTRSTTRMRLRAGFPGARRIIELAPQRHALRHRRGRRRTACSARASRACSSPGWMPRSAIGSSPRGWQAGRDQRAVVQRAAISWPDLAERLGQPAGGYDALAETARRRVPAFRKSRRERTFRCVSTGRRAMMRRFRPNQIFAVSLPHSPLDAESNGRASCVVGGASC